MVSLNSWIWRFLEDYVYYLPPPPPRKRPKNKPMEVIAVGLPRSATESLSQAFSMLGYNHAYHGWDILFEEPHNMIRWGQLCRRKYLRTGTDGDHDISVEDFDALLGHATAVADAPASVFAPEIIKAYPEAKVVLNINKDMDQWHQSVVKNIVGVNRSWMFWAMSWTAKNLFWAWHVAERMLWPAVFRCVDNNLEMGIVSNGKWVYREHCDMIRGLVPREKLLEWTVQDGWEPLCQFLGKEVPDEPFPHANTAAGFKQREKQAMDLWFGQGFKNIGKVAVVLAGVGAAYHMGFGAKA